MERDKNDIPLHVSAVSEPCDVIQHLVEKRKHDLNTASFQQTLPVHYACNKGNLDVIKNFIKVHKCDPVARDSDNNTPLHLGALNGHLNIVKYFVEELQCSPNTAGFDQRLPLHDACLNGHLDVVKYLIEVHKCDPVARDSCNNTPLHLGARFGQLNIVQYFVEELQCSPNTTGFDQRLPLHDACVNGHLDVVNYFIEVHKCDPVARDSDNNTPLHLGALNGHLNIVKYFVEELQCSPNITNFDQSLPLHAACENGHLDVVKYFIKVHKCDPVARDSCNNTPLHLGARFGQLNIVKYFVEELKYSPNTTGFQQRLPLHDACVNGHLDVVKYFIEVHKCDPVARDSDINTPIHLGALNGHLNIVKYFVEELQCSPNITNFDQNLPLHAACENGHLDVVKYFIEVQKCDPVARDSEKETPLHHGAFFGHLNIVQYFVEELKCSPNTTSLHQILPLHNACANGHLDVVKYFIEVHKCDPVARVNNNSTPLHIGASRGHLNIVQYLVEEVKCSPNTTTFDQRLPLHDACATGHLDVVKYFIEVHKCDPVARDSENNTPLHLVAFSGHLNIVQYFVEELKCSPNTTGFEQRLPIHYACASGQLDVVKYFIEVHKCYPMARDSKNSTPLHLGASCGHLNIVQYFVEELQFSPNATGHIQRLPLHDACVNGQLDVVKYFIEVHKCDPVARDSENSTPLHVGALNGHLNIVQYFVEELKCNPNVTGFQQRLPLFGACQNGHLDVVKYFIEVHKCDRALMNFQNYEFIHAALKMGHMNTVKYLIQHFLSFVGYRSNENIDKSKFMKSTYKFLHAVFFNDNNIIIQLVATDNVDMLQFICTHCRVDPVILKHFMHTKDLAKHSDILKFVKTYIDPLHKAAIFGDLEAITHYIIDKKWSPLLKDRHGNNLLHNAAQHGQLKIVKYLVKTVHCDPFIKNKNGLIAEQLALNNGFYAVESYLCCMTSTKLIVNKYSLSFTCCIMVMGNSGAGKSTLIKSIGSKKKVFVSQLLRVRGVKACTPGIVPHKIQSKDFGYVKIYDFSGHQDYYASHEKIIKHCKYPIVVIVVDISLPLSNINTQMSFWITVLSNSRNMKILVVGSHADKCESEEKKKQIDTYVSKLCSKASSIIRYHGFIECDCRYAVSRQMTTLHSKISTVTKATLLHHVKEESDYSNGLCASLMYHLRNQTEKLPTMSLGLLWQDIRELKSPGPALIQFTDKALLVEACTSLSSSGHILFFPHEDCPDKGLLVIDEELILNKVHSSLQAIRDAIDSDMGILKESQLKLVLSQFLTMPDFSEMALQYLVFSQFCTVISSQFLISKSKLPQKEDYYFFPNLVKAEAPDNYFCKENIYTDVYTWILQCDADNNFFTPQCIHTLFIQLIKCENSNRKIEFDIWKNGILRVSGNSVRTVVQFTDQTKCLKLMMQCHRDYKFELVKERSELITLIKFLVMKVNPMLKTAEYFLLPQPYPLTDYRKISLENVIQHVFRGERGVVISYGTGDCIDFDWYEISVILIFDSLQAVGMRKLQHNIYQHLESENSIPSQILQNIMDDLQDCQELQRILLNYEEINLTYKKMYEELRKFSVFTSKMFQKCYSHQREEVQSSDSSINVKLYASVNSSIHISANAVAQQFSSDSLKIKDLYAVFLGLSDTCIVNKWKEFGLALGLTSSSVTIIEKDHPDQSHRQLIELLVRWLNGEGNSSTWNEAVKATLSLSKHFQDFVQHIPKSFQDVSTSFEYSAGVSDLKLDDSSLRDILTYLRDLGHKWFYLGLSLGVPYNALKSIESEYRDPQRRLQKMLVRWLQDTHDHGSKVASWRSLAIGLKGPLVREFEVALKIEQEHPLQPQI